MHERFDGVGTVLVLTAHADDCEFFCGGLVAGLALEGVKIVEVIATDNGRGSFDLQPGELVARSRDIEAVEAARIIGKRHVEFLGYPDGFLDETPKSELRRVFFEWIRRVRPDCVISFDPLDMQDAHPDHRAVARAAYEAVCFAHLPLFHPEQIEMGLAPHMTPLRAWFSRTSEGANTFVDIGPVMDTKIDALLAHDTQMRLAMQEWKMMVQAGGRFTDLAGIFDPDNPRVAVTTIIRAWASSMAEGQAFDFGECFRLDRVDEMFEPFADAGH